MQINQFITPPTCQGQAVEISYLCVEEVIVKRVETHNTTDFYIHLVTGGEWVWYDSYSPVNGEPPVTEWQHVTRSKVNRLIAFGPSMMFTP